MLSIPPVIPDLDDPILHSHREFRRRLVGRRGERFAGAYAEPRPVARADDLVALDVSAGQLPAVVRAHVLDRVILTFNVEYDDAGAVDVHDAKRAWRELIRPGHGNPVRHASISRDVRTAWALRPYRPVRPRRFAFATARRRIGTIPLPRMLSAASPQYLDADLMVGAEAAQGNHRNCMNGHAHRW